MYLNVIWGISWFVGADLVPLEAASNLLFADTALTRKVAVAVGIVGNAVVVGSAVVVGIAVVFAVVVAVVVAVDVVVVVVVAVVVVLEVVIVVAAEVKVAAVVEVVAVAVVVADADVGGVVVDDECIPEYLRYYSLFYVEQSARLDCNIFESGEDDHVADDENRLVPFG